MMSVKLDYMVLILVEIHFATSKYIFCIKSYINDIIYHEYQANYSSPFPGAHMCEQKLKVNVRKFIISQIIIYTLHGCKSVTVAQQQTCIRNHQQTVY